MPVRPPPLTCATTSVVFDQARVPSASGRSVGISYTDAVTWSTTGKSRAAA